MYSHNCIFNIHAQRTWNCSNPLEGGQAVLQRRQAWEMSHLWLIDSLSSALDTWHISGSSPNPNLRYQHSSPPPKSGCPNRDAALTLETDWKPLWLIFLLTYPSGLIWIPWAVPLSADGYGHPEYSSLLSHSLSAQTEWLASYELPLLFDPAIPGTDILAPTRYGIGNAKWHVIISQIDSLLLPLLELVAQLKRRL